MTDHVLTIQRVLSDGAIAKTITCRSGRIAVLRSHAPEKLYDYELALRGQSENPGGFRITFDGAQYNASQHVFFGFDPIRFSSDISVTQFFLDLGQNEEQVKTLLLAHGFSQLAGTPISQLSSNESHCLALLQACNEGSPLWMMNDPFIPIPEAHREMYAQTIANAIWKNKSIGIVVSLSWRPDHWIDNDLITRVQVDQTQRRATVGIGAENPLTELAKQLRKEKVQIIEKKEQEKKEERRKSSSFEMFKEHLPQVYTLPVSMATIRHSGLFLLLIGTLWFVVGDVVSDYLNSHNTSVSSVGSNQTPSSIKTTQPLLDIYPSDIKEGVLAAFYGQAISEEKQQGASVSSHQSPQTPSSFPFPSPPKTNRGFPRAPHPSFTSLSSDNSPPGFQERMQNMMEGKDPAVRERIQMMIQRMREANPNFGQ